VDPLGKTGYEERLDQEGLFGRLRLILAWEKDLLAQLHAPNTSNEHRKQVKVGLEYLEQIEWMVRGTLHKALAKIRREDMGGAFSYPHLEAIDGPCACGAPHSCRLAGLIPDELSRRLKIWRRKIIKTLSQSQRALHAAGMTESDPLWPETKLATTPTSVSFRSPLRRAILTALKALGIDADYKSVGRFLTLSYRTLALPLRLIKVLPLEAMKKIGDKLDVGKLVSKRTEFTLLFEKEVSYVRSRMR